MNTRRSSGSAIRNTQSFLRARSIRRCWLPPGAPFESTYNCSWCRGMPDHREEPLGKPDKRAFQSPLPTRAAFKQPSVAGGQWSTDKFLKASAPLVIDILHQLFERVDGGLKSCDIAFDRLFPRKRCVKACDIRGSLLLYARRSEPSMGCTSPGWIAPLRAISVSWEQFSQSGASSYFRFRFASFRSARATPSEPVSARLARRLSELPCSANPPRR